VAAVLPAGESISNYLAAVGIRTRVRTMERAAFYKALESKKLKGLLHVRERRLRQRVVAAVGDAGQRGIYAYGAYPDIERSTASSSARWTRRSAR